MRILDRVRGPATLVALCAAYARRRPARVISGLAWATWVGVRARRAPVLRPRREVLAAGGELAPLCSLVSDTHLTAGGRAPAELGLDPGQWPFEAEPASHHLAAGVRRVLEHIRGAAPRTVIWCGDQVDTGDAAEWAGWREAVDAVPGLTHHLIPGNHDLSFNPPFDEDCRLLRRARRERAFQLHGPHLAAFPAVTHVAGERGAATLIRLDSCTHRSEHVLSNAIGRFGDAQLDELARILDDTRGPVLCVAHHHVWRGARFRQPDEWFNIAVDADRLGAILLAYRRRAAANHLLVCHGHRHTLTVGQIVDGDAAVDVVGLPSTTLGDKGPRGVLDGVLRYSVAGLRRDGRWGLRLVAVGAVVAARRAEGRAPMVVPDEELRELSPAA